MPVVSSVGNEQVNVRKMQIRGEPWQPPIDHLPLAPVTLISQRIIRNTKRTYLTVGLSRNQGAGGRGQTKGKKQQSYY